MRQGRITVLSPIDLSDRSHRYVLLTLLYVIAHLLLFYAALPLAGRPYAGPDPLTFELGGQFLATGRLPYVDLFDIKPPLAHLVPGIVATIIHTIGRHGFGRLDAVALHIASILLTLLMTLAALLLVSDLVDDLTDDTLAALAAGLVPCVFPFFYMQGITGFRPKAMVIVAGLLTLRWLHRERWLWAGTAAMIAPGLWQFGIIFPILAIGVAYRTGRVALGRVIAGCGVITTIMLIPFVGGGVAAFRAIVAEVVLLPFIVRPARDTGGFLSNTTAVIDHLGWPAFCLILLGAAGALVLPWQRRITATDVYTSNPATERLIGCLAIVVGWFSIQSLLIDGRGLPDPVVWVAFAAVGVGLIIAHLDNNTTRRLFVSIIVGAVVVVFATHAFDAFYGWRWMTQPEPAFQRVSTVYWRDVEPGTCHLRRAGDESTFVRLMGGQFSDRTCGQYTLETLLRILIS